MTSFSTPHRAALSGLRYTGRFVADFFRTFRFAEHWPPLAIIAAALLTVAAFWVGIYVVDFTNAWGLSSDQGFWWHAFRNRGPVELLQWLLIAAVIIFAARLSGIHQQRGERHATYFWLLIAIGFSLMLIEDPGDPRHILGAYFPQFFGWDKMYVEAVFFSVMVAPTIFAFLRFWNVPFRYAQTRLYLIAGGLLYALAASTSVLRSYDEFYIRVGERLSNRFLDGEIPGFFLMDFVLEESVELMAAATFLAGVYVYWRLVTATPPDS